MVDKGQTTQHKTEVVHDLIEDDAVAAQVLQAVAEARSATSYTISDLPLGYGHR